MINTGAKLRHLDLVEGIITRMAQNSFLIKGWSVVLVSAMFALASKDSEVVFGWLAVVPVAMFWGLDGYFVWQERRYRRLYNEVRRQPETAVDFSMDTEQFVGGQATWSWSTFSITLCVFHGTLLAALVVTMLVLSNKG